MMFINEDISFFVLFLLWYSVRVLRSVLSGAGAAWRTARPQLSQSQSLHSLHSHRSLHDHHHHTWTLPLPLSLAPPLLSSQALLYCWVWANNIWLESQDWRIFIFLLNSFCCCSVFSQIFRDSLLQGICCHIHNNWEFSFSLWLKDKQQQQFTTTFILQELSNSFLVPLVIVVTVCRALLFLFSGEHAHLSDCATVLSNLMQVGVGVVPSVVLRVVVSSCAVLGGGRSAWCAPIAAASLCSLLRIASFAISLPLFKKRRYSFIAVTTLLFVLAWNSCNYFFFLSFFIHITLF